ncbi:MAG: GntR family transcriptional regulator [Terrisporobacter othiniensis]|uniref:GntR family transcriptional regulator n=1 Tax=Terrisporobacter othiniensis TaxID=1577792 RepID=UPI000941F5AB|nr:GntR family transcriptional regulator [Terrisporobacter othiniensis]MDU6984707.1 GntR family transcriptional regulator [Terrisporobacter othiniensis]
MKIIISSNSDLPIYLQIVNQIKDEILSGKINENEMLPSMRALAKELGISFITTKRSYEELEKQGLINTIPGKGCFVSAFNKEIVFEAKMREIEEKLEEAIYLSNMIGLTKEQLILTLESLYEGE